MHSLSPVVAGQAALVILLAAAALLGSAVQAAAVIDFSRSTVSTLQKCDDCSAQVDIGFTINFGGSFSKLYVNNNGLLSFTAPRADLTFAQTFPTATNYGPLIAPFWADVDTNRSGSVSVARTMIGSYNALAVTWTAVPAATAANDRAGAASPEYLMAADGTSKGTNTFQAILMSRPDLASGAFNVIFNYDKISWQQPDYGTSSSSPSLATYGLDNRVGNSYNGRGTNTNTIWDGGANALNKASLNASGVAGRQEFLLGYSGSAPSSTLNPSLEDLMTPVPEPSGWMMMIGGFGIVGAAMRRRRPWRAAAVSSSLA